MTSKKIIFKGILLLLALTTQTMFAWNARYDEDWNKLKDFKNGHNWITNKAIDQLKKRNLWYKNIPDETIKYIHYGSDFADHPWNGRPDNIDGEVKGIMYNYQRTFRYECVAGRYMRMPAEDGKPFSCCFDGHQCHERKKIYYNDYVTRLNRKTISKDTYNAIFSLSDTANDKVYTQFYKDSSREYELNPSKPNLYVRAAWYAYVPSAGAIPKAYATKYLRVYETKFCYSSMI